MQDIRDTDIPILYKPAKAAQLTDLSRATIYELISTGRLKALSIGRSKRIARTDLLEFIDGLRDGSAPGDIEARSAVVKP